MRRVRVPDADARQIPLWKDDTRQRYPPVPKDTVFSRDRPAVSAREFDGTGPTVSDLEDVKSFLGHLEASTAAIAAEAEALYADETRRTRRRRVPIRKPDGRATRPPPLGDRARRELAGDGIFPVDDVAAGRRDDAEVDKRLFRAGKLRPGVDPSCPSWSFEGTRAKMIDRLVGDPSFEGTQVAC